jgi:hypothetical protein
MRLSNITGWTLATYLFACGETMSLRYLVPLGFLTAGLLWFSLEVHEAIQMPADTIAGAPIASAVARDLGIQP